MPDQANCRSCSAPILWVKTASGLKMPLDAEPVEDGNVVLIEGAAHVLKKDQPAGTPRYKSHFATCPGAGQWRKK